MSQFEAKFLQVGLEVKAQGDQGKFTGYGSVFGNIDSYRDVVQRGAFANTIRQGKRIPILWQHDMREPIGVFESMKEDDNGLFVEGQLNMETTRGREAFALLKQGAIKGLSIGYIPEDSDFDPERNIRTLTDIKLMEISLVTFPANVEAEVVGFKNCNMSAGDFERLLREAGGFSRSAAKTITAKGFKAFLEQRDAEDGKADDQVLSLLSSIKSGIEKLSK